MLLKSRRLLVFLAFALSALAFDFDDEEEPAPAARGAGAQPTFFDDESAGTTVALEHSFDGATFAPRGKLFYRDSRAGGVSRASVRVSQAKLSGDSLDEFQALLATGGHYTLRVPSVLNDPQSPPVFTSVSVCSLMASRSHSMAGSLDGSDEELDGSEETVNQDPYGGGWLVKISLSNPGSLDGVMDAEAYKAKIAD